MKGFIAYSSNFNLVSCRIQRSNAYWFNILSKAFDSIYRHNQDLHTYILRIQIHTHLSEIHTIKLKPHLLWYTWFKWNWYGRYFNKCRNRDIRMVRFFWIFLDHRQTNHEQHFYYQFTVKLFLYLNFFICQVVRNNWPNYHAKFCLNQIKLSIVSLPRM